MRRMVIACLVPVVCGACAGGRPALAPRTPDVSSSRTASAPPALPPCDRRTTHPAPAPAGDERQGGSVALARTGERLLAYVADADSRSIHTVAVDERRELVRTRLAGTPAQVLVLRDGRVVTTLSDGTRIMVLEPAENAAEPLAVVCERELPAEPWGLAMSPDEGTLLVTSAWGSALSVLDARTFGVRRVVALPRDPRAVLVDAEGVAFVSHLVGAKMSALSLRQPEAAVQIVDLAAHKASPRAAVNDMQARRTSSQGYALAKIEVDASGPGAMSRVLAPMASVEPGDLSRPTSAYYGQPFDGVPKEAPYVSAVDPATLQPLGHTLVAATEAPYARECLLPRAAATRNATGSLYVACLGIDAVLELDGWALDPFRAERRRFSVPPGPAGIAIDATSGRAVVFSQMSAKLTIVDLDHAAADRPEIALDYHPEPALAEAAYGRMLFYRTDDVRISNDGVACASCHQDGRDDGVTWNTPMGPRQTPMLAGRLDKTAPYGWEGDRPTLVDYVGNTVVRLGGRGLARPELEAIAQFLLVAQAPPRTADDPDQVRRGRQLFTDPAQQCDSCHAGDASTDASVHGFPKSGADPTGFDTPSLRFLSGTAPYFHDGRYPTLDALLADPQSRMGQSASLGPSDRAALAAYLRSL